MNKNIKEIKETLTNDELLAELTDAAKVMKGHAQSLETRAVMRKYELLDELQSNSIAGIPSTYDLDEIEKGIESIESRESKALKVMALDDLISMPWREEPNFREAAEQYLVYIEPILKDIEEVKEQNRRKIEELDQEYKNKRLKLQTELGDSEALIINLLKVTEDHGKWIDQRSFLSAFNKRARADSLANSRAKVYKI